MRRLALLAPMLLAAAAPKPAPPEPLAPEPAVIATLAPDAEARWVAFTLTPANQIRFTAMLDGRPVAAILDTGVSYSALSRRFVTAARMRVRPAAAALAVGGWVASGWADTRLLAIGALTRRGGRASVADLPAAATGGDAVDLLVGRDVTAGYALDIDYPAKRFRLLPSGRMPFRGSVAPLRIAGRWPSYVTELTIGTRHVDRVMVDTGDGGTLTVSRATWERLGPTPVTVATTAYGLAGPLTLDVATLPLVRSGDVPLRAVETRIERAGGFIETIGMRARIGSGMLGAYRVLLDPGAGRMVLAAGPTQP